MSNDIEWGPWIAWTDDDRSSSPTPVGIEELVWVRLDSGRKLSAMRAGLWEWGNGTPNQHKITHYRVRADHPIYQEQDTGEWHTAASVADVPANATEIKYKVKPMEPVKCWVAVREDGSVFAVTTYFGTAEAWEGCGFTVFEGTFTPNEVQK